VTKCRWAGRRRREDYILRLPLNASCSPEVSHLRVSRQTTKWVITALHSPSGHRKGCPCRLAVCGFSDLRDLGVLKKKS